MREPESPPKVRVDRGTYTEETFIAQVVYESNCSDDYYDGRPKTRRIDIVDEERLQDILNGAIDESRMEELTSLERLQLKLNTISEMNESDLSSSMSSNSAPVCKLVEKVTTATTYSNTEPVVQQAQETQVEPEVKSSGTQMVLDILDSTTQTERQEKELTIENTAKYEISEPQKSKKLTLQNMPPINIAGDLVCQKIYQLSIDPSGKTNIHYTSGKENVGYVEVYGDDVATTSLAALDLKNKVRMLTDVDSNNISSLDLELDNITLDSNPDPLVENMTESDIPRAYRNSLGTKEMFYRSFQLLDNPNMHDPGELSAGDVDVTAIDTSVYKTFINPDGYPEAVSDPERRTVRATKSVLKQFTSAASTPIRKPSMQDKDHQKSPVEIIETTRSEINSKLWDIGLYCSKCVQCNFPTEKNQVEDYKRERASVTSMERTLNTSSYERISLTISYSTDETDSSNNTETEQTKPYEHLVGTTERTTEEPIPDSPKPISKISSPLPRKLNVRPEKMDQAEMSISWEKEKAGEPSVATSRQKPDAWIRKSILEKKENVEKAEDTTVHTFISGLVNAKSDDLRKVIPKVSSKTWSSKDKTRQYTVMPLQIHGDCWPDEHLKLADNGRYKDEENLFSKSSYSNFEDISLRRRALRCLPRYTYRMYNVATQDVDSISVDDTISEGEVKCQCHGSLGEVHRCKSLEPSGNRRQQRPENRTFKDDVGGTVRERRSYFNNLITYYVDKKAPFSDRSTPNSR